MCPRHRSPALPDLLPCVACVLVPAPSRDVKQLTFTFHAKRMYLATLFNNLLPVFFITSVGVFSFYLPRAVSSASQTIITTTAFLAAMAFSVTLQSTLPAVRYLTRANILVIISYTVRSCVLGGVWLWAH